MEQQNNEHSQAISTAAQRGVQALTTYSTSFQKAVTKLASELDAKAHEATNAVLDASAQLEDLVYNTQVQENKLAEVSKKLNAAERDAAAELNIRVKENEDEVLEDLLQARQLAWVECNTLEALRAQVSGLTEDRQDAIDKAVGEAIGRANSKHSHEMAIKAAEFERDSQKALHSIESLESQLASARGQIADLQNQINAERDARIKIAEYSGQNHVTINGQTK